MKETFALAAVLLVVAGNLPYIRDTLKGKVKPHPYTWLLWALVSGIILLGQMSRGAGVGALPTAASEIFALAIFLASLKYGFAGITKTDTVFLTLALAGIIPWMLTSDPTLSVVMAVGIDLAAFVPTIRKTWHFPATESPTLYITNTLRHVLTLYSLRAFNLVTALHSLVMVFANILMAALIVFERRKNGLKN